MNRMWDDVVRPLVRFGRNHEPDAQLLPEKVIHEFCKVLSGGSRPQPQEQTLWMAFAFTVSSRQLLLPLKLGLLEGGIKRLGGFAPHEPERNLPELNHAFLVLLGEIERGGEFLTR